MTDLGKSSQMVEKEGPLTYSSAFELLLCGRSLVRLHWVLELARLDSGASRPKSHLFHTFFFSKKTTNEINNKITDRENISSLVLTLFFFIGCFFGFWFLKWIAIMNEERKHEKRGWSGSLHMCPERRLCTCILGFQTLTGFIAYRYSVFRRSLFPNQEGATPHPLTCSLLVNRNVQASYDAPLKSPGCSWLEFLILIPGHGYATVSMNLSHKNAYYSNSRTF